MSAATIMADGAMAAAAHSKSSQGPVDEDEAPPSLPLDVAE